MINCLYNNTYNKTYLGRYIAGKSPEKHLEQGLTYPQK